MYDFEHGQANQGMPFTTVIPVLSYRDAGAASEWLCRVFDFKIRWRAGNHRAQLAIGNGAIAISGFLASEGRNDGELLMHSIMVRVTQVDNHYEQAKANGAEIIQQPTDFPYGERQYTVKDIGGHTWTFSQSIADISPGDWGATSS